MEKRFDQNNVDKLNELYRLKTKTIISRITEPTDVKFYYNGYHIFYEKGILEPSDITDFLNQLNNLYNKRLAEKTKALELKLVKDFIDI